VFVLTAEGKRHPGGEGIFPLLSPGLDGNADPLRGAFEGGFLDRKRRFYTGPRNRRVVRKLIRDLQPEVVSPWDLWGYSYSPLTEPLTMGVRVAGVQLEPWLTNAWLEGARARCGQPGAGLRDRLRRFLVKRMHRDVLRLSRAMTYKAAVAGLDIGGGKAVIIADPSTRSEGLFRAFGRQVESLGGRYITAEDMNTTVEDMGWIRRETRWVTGKPLHERGLGDPSPVTGWGVFHGIRACLEVVYGSPDVAGRTVAIQGVGAVGYHVARFLHDAGARLLYADISSRALKRAVDDIGGDALEDDDDFYGANCDVLVPCAVGGVLNADTVPRIRAPIVAGGANNQLDDEERDGQALEAAGITYAPDYVINAGGLCLVYAEYKGYPQEKAMADAANIFNSVKKVINKARSEGITPTAASNRLARERIEEVARLRRLYLPSGKGARPSGQADR
jgi:leucine dehydrogenase